MTSDVRLVAPATARNRDPILTVLRQHMPLRGLVLEIASGSGEHIAYFAQALSPDLQFQPSDADVRARASIDAWVNALGVCNVLPAIALDACAQRWPVLEADAVIALT